MLILLSSFALVSSVLLGGLLALGYTKLVLLISIFPIGILVIKLLGSVKRNSKGNCLPENVLKILIVGFLFLPALGMLVRQDLSQYLDLFIYLFLPVVLWRSYTHLTKDATLKMVAFLFFMFLALSILSTYFGRSNFSAATYQFAYNLKIISMLLIGVLFVPSDKFVVWFEKIVQYFWVIIALFLLLQLIASHVDFIIFPHHESIFTEKNSILMKLTYKLPGIYVHSGQLVIVSIVFFVYSLLKVLNKKDNRFFVPIFAYAIIMILSGQRNEIIALLGSLVILGMLLNKKKLLLYIPFLLLGVIFVIIGLVWFFPGSEMEKVAYEWGILGHASQGMLQARAIFHIHAIDIAKDYFPLGAGLGTYGGVGAQKFDWSFYYELGYQIYYYWFRAGHFLVDTYWPNYLAETGIFGFFFYASIFLVLLLRLGYLVVSPNGDSFYINLAFVLFLMMLLNSITSPLLSDPKFTVLSWIFIGVALRPNKKIIVGNQ